MSFFTSVLRAAYKLSGAKKAFTLPEDEILTVIEKQNRSRGVFTPKDHKAHYEMITVKEMLIYSQKQILMMSNDYTLVTSWKAPARCSHIFKP